MNTKLAASVAAPILFAAAVVGMSRPLDAAQRQQKQKTQSFIVIGFGDHDEPTVNPDLPVLRHDVEHYYDRPSDRIMTLEAIEYEDGSAATKIGPHRPQFDFQAAPLTGQPILCSLALQSANDQCNSVTGMCHVDASVLCRQNGSSFDPCSKVSFVLVLYKFEAGGWKIENQANGQAPTRVACNATTRPFLDAFCGGPGTFRFYWAGWNTDTGQGLWALTTDMTYAG